VGEQDSQKNLQGTELSFDVLQTSAAGILGFLASDPPSADGSRDMTSQLWVDRSLSPTLSRRLSLSLNRTEPAQQETSDSERIKVEQGPKGSVGECN